MDQGTRAIETIWIKTGEQSKACMGCDSFFERSSLAMAVAHRIYRKTGGYGFDLVFIVRLRSGSFRNETGHFTTLFILAMARNGRLSENGFSLLPQTRSIWESACERNFGLNVYFHSREESDIDEAE